jgi:hypothetical protein
MDGKNIVVKFSLPSVDESLTWKDFPISIAQRVVNTSFNLGDVTEDLDTFAKYLPFLEKVPFHSEDFIKVLTFYKNPIELSHDDLKLYTNFITIENDIPTESDTFNIGPKYGVIMKLLLSYPKLFNQLGIKNVTREDITIPSTFIELINSKFFELAKNTTFSHPIQKYIDLNQIPQSEIDAIAGIEYLHFNKFNLARPVSRGDLMNREYYQAYSHILNGSSNAFSKPLGISMREKGLGKIVTYHNGMIDDVSIVIDPGKVCPHNKYEWDDNDIMLAFETRKKSGIYWIIPMQVFRDEEDGKPLILPEGMTLTDQQRKYVNAYSKIRDWRLTGKKCPDPRPLKK